MALEVHHVLVAQRPTVWHMLHSNVYSSAGVRGGGSVRSSKCIVRVVLRQAVRDAAITRVLVCGGTGRRWRAEGDDAMRLKAYAYGRRGCCLAPPVRGLC